MRRHYFTHHHRMCIIWLFPCLGRRPLASSCAHAQSGLGKRWRVVPDTLGHARAAAGPGVQARNSFAFWLRRQPPQALAHAEPLPHWQLALHMCAATRGRRRRRKHQQHNSATPRIPGGAPAMRASPAPTPPHHRHDASATETCRQPKRRTQRCEEPRAKELEVREYAAVWPAGWHRARRGAAPRPRAVHRRNVV